MTPYRAVVFDFDLTLVDSRAAFVDCHTFAARAVRLPPPAPEAVFRTIGTPLVRVVPWLYGPAGEAVADEYIRVYQARADEVMTGLTTVVPGAADAVAALAGAGLRLGIVSQKLRYRVEDVLRRDDLLDYFAVVLGAEEVADFKPDPSGLLLAVERLGARPESALYVGDTAIDAETARRAGVAFVAVLSGVTTREELAPHAPLALLDSVRDLPAFLGLPGAPERLAERGKPY